MSQNLVSQYICGINLLIKNSNHSEVYLEVTMGKKKVKKTWAGRGAMTYKAEFTSTSGAKPVTVTESGAIPNRGKIQATVTHQRVINRTPPTKVVESAPVLLEEIEMDFNPELYK